MSSTQEEILRLQTARDKIRAKTQQLGISTGTSKLDELATAIENIEDQGAVSASVKEGETYTIPKGYHNGSGTVSGIAGDGQYTLQSKTVTPTKMQQNITPDSGNYGLSDVTVNAIPDNYQDVSSVTATKEDVLSTKVFITSTGETVAGTMMNNGAVDKTLDVSTQSYTVPKGYHDGLGSVKIVTEEKQVTPTKSQQIIDPTSGKVISKVTVEPIPSEYQDVSGVTAEAEHVLVDHKFVTPDGTLTEGAMINNGAVEASFDGISVTSYNIPKGYHDGSGTVSLTSAIEEALAAI